MKNREEAPQRVQLNARIDGKVATKVRMVAAARRSNSNRWTQDAIVEAGLRLLFNCPSKENDRLVNEIRATAKLFQGSFNTPESQSTGFAV